LKANQSLPESKSPEIRPSCVPAPASSAQQPREGCVLAAFVSRFIVLEAKRTIASISAAALMATISAATTQNPVPLLFDMGGLLFVEPMFVEQSVGCRWIPSVTARTATAHRRPRGKQTNASIAMYGT
jgi:hypothetical protein